MARWYVSALVLGYCFYLATCMTINWTGQAGDNQWGTARNWDANKVPGSGDDAVINVGGGTSVQVSSTAVANSLTIGGGSYNQALTILSQLTIGPGGIKVNAMGSITLLSSGGTPLGFGGNFDVFTQNGFSFSSGTIAGPGSLVVHANASASMITTALKGISGCELDVYGSLVVNPSAILLTNGGSIFGESNSNIQFSGSMNVYSTDSSGKFTTFGTWSYSGGSDSFLLSIPTKSSGPLNIVSGTITVQSAWASNNTVTISSGASLLLQATGDDGVQFGGPISGQGTFIVAGTSTVYSTTSFAVNSMSLQPGSSAQFTAGTNSVVMLTLSGILAVDKPAGLTITNATINGGGLSGDGTISISTMATFNTKGTTMTVGGTVTLNGDAQVTGPTTLIMSGDANLVISTSSTFTAYETLTILQQTGTPVFTNNGIFMGSFPNGQMLSISNVPVVGTGSFTSNGTISLTGASFATQKVQLTDGASLNFNTETFSISTITGNGVVNVTTQSTPASSLGIVAAAQLIVMNGGVNVQTFTVTTLTLNNGQLTLSSPSQATNLNFNGGTLQGSTVTTTTTTFGGVATKTLSAVGVTASNLTFACTTQCTYILQNNASIKG